ncbi:LPS biosynthesis rfbu related protein [Nocardioides baekrokdamisoli]|uniref:LPS biosynthesis rfbu related protein n=1 Tax=Nocardioides baekrokdamisoli TaxID=1804624 RepID=A0A3G9IAI2_9ACTN|nr:glycosyltransferase family 4 protein [Nocardioides baekrokdamisoli]BBH15747.1 LPS biosynthesis rfbu related protein [Nocardioides baekrokdamisoli]
MTNTHAPDLRVAVVAPLYAPHIGGVERYAEKVVHALRDTPGITPVMITAAADRRTTIENVNGYELIRLGSWIDFRGSRLNPLWLWTLPRLLRRKNIDVVYAHSPVPGLSDIVTYRSAGRPVVLAYHSGTMVKGGRTDPILRAWERWVLPRIFARATRLVAAGKTALAYATGRATVIPAGIDVDTFKPDGDRRETTLTYVGRIEAASRWKGYQVVVDALPAILERVPEAYLDIIGDGDDVALVQAAAGALGVGDRIRWLGGMAPDQVAQRLRRTSVAVVPSLTDADCASQVLMEAMASGTPVVGAAVGGMPENIRHGENGFLVPPGDAPRLAHFVAEVLADPQLAERLGKAARLDAVEKFAIAGRHRALLEILAEITGRDLAQSVTA